MSPSKPAAHALLVAVILLGVLGDRGDAQPVTARAVVDLIYDPDERASLTHIQDLVVDSLLDVYVNDRAQHGILLFDRDGEFRRRVGREGEGPGEFKLLTALGFQADTLWAADQALRRVSFFNPTDFSLLRTERLQAPLGSGRSVDLRPGAILADGSWLVQERLSASRLSEAGDMDWRIYRIRHSEDLPPPQSPIVELDLGRSWMVAELPGGAQYGTRQPWVSPDVIKVSDNGRFLYVIRQPDGIETRQAKITVENYSVSSGEWEQFTISYEPVRFDQERVSEWVSGRLEGGELLRVGPRGAITEALRRSLETPEFLPALRSAGSGIQGYEVIVTDHGDVWLGLNDDASGARSTEKVLHGYSRNGRRVGVVALDASVRPLAIRRDYLWGVRRDSLDVPELARYHLRTK